MIRLNCERNFAPSGAYAFSTPVPKSFTPDRSHDPPLAILLATSSLVSSALADRTEWFREARYGMFIHWGVYAVPAGEWEGETIRGIGEWIMRFKRIPVDQYKAFAPDATEASPFPRRLPWGSITQKVAGNGGTTLCLHVWDWPADGEILLPTLQELPFRGSVLADGAEVSAENSADGVVVLLPGESRDPDVSVVRLDFPAGLTISQQPYATPSADGTITLLAHDADPHGATGGNIRVECSGG